MNNKLLENVSELSELTHIIVLMKYQDEFTWYVSDRDVWVMDYEKYIKLFESSIDCFTSLGRSNIRILSERTVEDFIIHMVECKASKQQLSQLVHSFLPLTSWDEHGFLFPSLFVDFDRQHLFSLYGESLSFENYVPDGWYGQYENFYMLIPEEEKYWVIDGKDWFQEILKKY